MQNTNIMGIMALIWPIILIQLAIQVYAVIDILKHKKTKHLDPTVWIIIVILGEVIGSVLYFAIGRSDSEEA